MSATADDLIRAVRRNVQNDNVIFLAGYAENIYLFASTSSTRAEQVNLTGSGGLNLRRRHIDSTTYAHAKHTAASYGPQV